MNGDKEFRILVGTIAYNQDNQRIINGLEFGNADDEQIAISTVTGLETAPIRNNYGDWSGRDGGFMSSQLYGARIITIQGFYWDDNYACGRGTPYRTQFPYSVRERLANYLKIRKEYPIFIKFPNNKVLYTSGYMTNFKMDYEFVRYGNYQVTFVCPNHELSVAEVYGDPDSIWHRATLHKEIFGGHLVPEEMPVLFEAGQHPTVIEYEGLIPHYPKITLVGPSTNPTFYNTAVNKFFRLGNPDDPDQYFSLAAGSTLVIDMRNRQATVNGKSVSMDIDPDSEWWYLAPGQNRIYMMSEDTMDTPTAEIIWSTDLQGA